MPFSGISIRRRTTSEASNSFVLSAAAFSAFLGFPLLGFSAERTPVVVTPMRTRQSAVLMRTSSRNLAETLRLEKGSATVPVAPVGVSPPGLGCGKVALNGPDSRRVLFSAGRRKQRARRPRSPSKLNRSDLNIIVVIVVFFFNVGNQGLAAASADSTRWNLRGKGPPCCQVPSISVPALF